MFGHCLLVGTGISMVSTGCYALITDDKYDSRDRKNEYLTIFSITDSEASVFFPNSYETDNKLLPIKVYDFPLGDVEYALDIDRRKQEINRLLFVFTKSYIPFIKMNENLITTEESIFNWIYSIMPDQRKVEYYNLVVKSNI